MFTGPMNPGAALIAKFCGTNISANVRDATLSHKIDHQILNLEGHQNYWLKNHGNFADLVYRLLRTSELRKL